MKRRDFLRTTLSALLCMGIPSPALAEIFTSPGHWPAAEYDRNIKDYLDKMRNFDSPHHDDLLLGHGDRQLLKSSLARFNRLQRLVGHGNFHLLSFDEALIYAGNNAGVGSFTGQELNFLEKIFYDDARPYGFLGEKPVRNITDRIRIREVVKVRGTGNYLHRGEALQMYKKIRRELGKEVILTSGIRSVVKQFLLFLDKADQCNGNLSQASRSLAPPGYSFHSVGDFDVGQVGFGALNFTNRFAETDVFRKLVDLGYIKLRYNQDNLLGVRYEPWHIKVV